MNNTIKIEERRENLLFFQASGWSMWPFLKGKDKLVVKKTDPDALKIGDLVLYGTAKQLICHRLVKKTKTNDQYILYARGDASWGRPEPIKQEELLGKVVGVVKKHKITYIDGKKQRLINRIILFSLPIFILVNKAYNFFLVKNE